MNRNMSTHRILDAIGNTPLVELSRIVPPGSARIVVKLESSNPTGSMKDRVAKAMIERAAADGRLPAGGTVVAKRLGPGATVGTIIIDTGLRYISTDVFKA